MAPFSHLPLFLRLGHVAGNGGDVQRPQKLQKVLVEAHQGTLPLDDSGEHVVMDEFFGSALEKVEGIQETAMQGLLPLRVGKLQIQAGGYDIQSRPGSRACGWCRHR